MDTCRDGPPISRCIGVVLEGLGGSDQIGQEVNGPAKSAMLVMLPGALDTTRRLKNVRLPIGSAGAGYRPEVLDVLLGGGDG
jgi:hypothetical protein